MHRNAANTHASPPHQVTPAPRDADGPASSNPRRALIVGAGWGGEFIARELCENLEWNLWPMGFVDDDLGKQRQRIHDIPVLGDISTMPDIVRREVVDVIVLAIPSAPQPALDEVARVARATGADVVTMPSIGAILSGEQRAETLRRVRVTDVLGRPMVAPDRHRCSAFIRDRRVLITGAAGSIGRELAVQVAGFAPRSLVILDTNESDLHDLQLDLTLMHPGVEAHGIVASINDAHLVDTAVEQAKPDIVFHAAAYKHVPLMEQYPGQALQTNVIGTRNVAMAAARSGAERFVLVSTDKAVRPTSVMGATKRLAEVVLAEVSRKTGMSSCSVRFGNVLGSRGSVIPTFERQIRAGGPVTVTDARMRRYFMTIEEAASLIIQSGAFGHRDAICILDMGEDVLILDLAERVIELHGLRPRIDIAIEFSGMRPGEKLREDLSHDFEVAQPSLHPKIRILRGSNGEAVHCGIDRHLLELDLLAREGRNDTMKIRLHELIRHVDNLKDDDGNHSASA